MKWMEHLQSLGYADRPDYKYLHNQLAELFALLNGTDETLFDWEVPSPRMRHPRPLPKLLDLCIVVLSSKPDYLRDFADSKEPLPDHVSKLILQFLIRINKGRISRTILDNLLTSKITELDLVSCASLNEGDYKHMALRFTQLKMLSLGATTNSSIKPFLANNHKLEELSMYCSTKLTNRVIKSMSEKCPALRVLSLKSSDKLNDRSVETILRKCVNLEELSLLGCKKIKGTAFKVLQPRRGSFLAKKRMFKLVSVNLSYCELSRRGFRTIVRAAVDFRKLHFLPLSTSQSFKITSSDFVALVQNTPNLETMDLSNYHFDLDPVLLKVARCCPNLTTLLLDGIGMTDYGLQSVVHSCMRLSTIRFRYGDGVTDASLLAIAEQCGTNLKSLTLDFWPKYNLSETSVSEHAIQLLLKGCSKLEKLSLCNCVILTESCFPDEAYLPDLTALNLSECIQVNDVCVKKITMSCPNLRKFELNNVNALSGDALKAIAIGCPMLGELYLISCSCFTDNEIRKLLKSMPNLFVQVTRYTDFELREYIKEVHALTVDETFMRYPNNFREKAFEKTIEYS
eukprot:TRINITY_DN10350_c0_g1_i1.p1 TRINITY_DN10350_c0_g1~~TRINITY_DN10350_c0_g1_i1.p1  ORF type:complete len:619 (-),score=76.36 TRINITY_DN10350_c0_g1_i1:42-1751(-)